MKIKVLIIILLVAPLSLMAQRYQPLPNFYRPIDSATVAQNKQQEQDKTDFGVTLGTGFSSFSGNSMMQSYVAPHFNYQVNENLQLQFTGIVATSNGSLFNNNQGFVPSNNSAESYAFSGSGVYQATEKLTFSAGASYMENSMKPFNLYPNQQQTDYKSFSFGMGYKFNENTSIGLEFRFSDGYNPYYSPYNNFHNTNPFYSNHPFGW